MKVPIFSILGGKFAATLQPLVDWQKSVLRVMTVLPGKYRYDQVEAAVRASGVHPSDIYNCLAANRNTFALQRFYEALGKP